VERDRLLVRGSDRRFGDHVYRTTGDRFSVDCECPELQVVGSSDSADGPAEVATATMARVRLPKYTSGAGAVQKRA